MGGGEKGRWKRTRKGSLCRSQVCSGDATGVYKTVCINHAATQSSRQWRSKKQTQSALINVKHRI